MEALFYMCRGDHTVLLCFVCICVLSFASYVAPLCLVFPIVHCRDTLQLFVVFVSILGVYLLCLYCDMGWGCICSFVLVFLAIVSYIKVSVDGF